VITESLGQLFIFHGTSDVANRKQRPWITEVLQGARRAVISAKRGNLLLRRLRPGPELIAAIYIYIHEI
jgi:hypothetical protein